MKEAAQHLMAEIEENGFSFVGPRRQLILSIMEKYLNAARPQEPQDAAE